MKKATGLVIFVILLAISSCGGELGKKELSLPETPLLTEGEEWGVITSDYISLKEEPKEESDAVTWLRKGDIVSITTLSEWQEVRKGFLGCWYHVEINSRSGWVFENQLNSYATKTQAENAAAKIGDS